MNAQLEALAERGILGNKRTDVAVHIISQWLWEHVEQSRVQAAAAAAGTGKVQQS